jgi:hypothetical protein
MLISGAVAAVALVVAVQGDNEGALQVGALALIIFLVSLATFLLSKVSLPITIIIGG